MNIRQLRHVIKKMVDETEVLINGEQIVDIKRDFNTTESKVSINLISEDKSNES